ncbi:hypothetical protein ABZ401_10075 [Streptomyces sp. NPDC005892]|uniref:hypothetical protein n=1 Tax=Streptomyces sp. NPDC005892 TaxID=3155593 RepID=UPI00340090CD
MTQVVTLSAPNAQEYVALAEIELCGELMIAASSSPEDRLSPDRIDEVLNVGEPPERPTFPANPNAGPDPAGPGSVCHLSRRAARPGTAGPHAG